MAKSVLVTGATGGIGKVAVRRLEELGWRVFAGVRSLEAGERLAAGGSRVVPVEMDICDSRSIDEARRIVAGHLRGDGLDGLVNNAGASVDGPIELLSLDALRRQLELNVIGQVAVTQAFLPDLRAQHGRIVMMGGAAGRLTLPMYGALSASKGALDSLSDALRMELKHQGVSVSYIEPGAIRTGFFGVAAEAAKHDRRAGISDLERIYTRAIDDAAKGLAGSPSSPPEHAVRAIVRALTARRPAARYVVGRQAWMGLHVLLHLPVGVRDRVLMSSLTLNRKSFARA
jgi:NAD(P)-dependent dehydrogenase (short-subunit alcohol dehydrogenase family)